MTLRSSFPIVSILILVSFIFSSCAPNSKPETQHETTVQTTSVNKTPIVIPEFNGDSAYKFVQQQVDFGPRIPGTESHKNCASWLDQKLRSFSFDVTVQKGVATTFDKKRYNIYNIIGSYNPHINDRILLCAHWDTRPFADRDEGENKNKVFDGANDGGSGVGVLLEVARQLNLNKPEIGVDIIFFDLEDYGDSGDDESWCLGSQYWAKNLHQPGYFARFGILLDMVGAKDATFPKEGTSRHFASGVVDKVWSSAKEAGYSNYFIDKNSNPTTDDHLFVNRDANIPCIVVVDYNVYDRDYFPHHHRVTDNMENIDRQTLNAVGQTMLKVLFEESAMP